jgi:SRSO17 transposase
VAQAPWSDQAVLARVRERVLPSITRDEAVQAWIVDDTGFPKKGSHSVGVARQYCGQVGKQDNCQVAVSLSLATHQGSLPIGYRLYLPKGWADDPLRRAIAGVPDDVRFQTKPQIALRQMRQAAAGSQSSVPPGYRPRGATAAVATPHTALNRNAAYPPRTDLGSRPSSMPLLRTQAAEGSQGE